MSGTSRRPARRFLVIEQTEQFTESLPPGTRLVAEGDSLDALLEPLGAKAGVSVDLTAEFDPEYRRQD